VRAAARPAPRAQGGGLTRGSGGRWVFSVAANLPDTTAPAILAKEAWSQGEEQRPQLAWLFKPQVENPCVMEITEPAIVWHQAQFTRDMQFLLTVGQTDQVYVWRMPRGRLVHRLAGHEDHIMSIQLSCDDTMLVTASRDGTVILWRLSDEVFPEYEEEEEDSRSVWSSKMGGSQAGTDELSRTHSHASKGSKTSGQAEGDITRASSRAGRQSKPAEEEDSPSKAGSKKRPGTAGTRLSRRGKDHWVEGDESDDDARSRSSRAGARRGDEAVSSPVAALIPAHLATVWSCALSTVFRMKAEVWTEETVDLGHGETRVDRLAASARFLDLTGGTRPVSPDRFPVSMKGTLRKVNLSYI